MASNRTNLRSAFVIAVDSTFDLDPTSYCLPVGLFEGILAGNPERSKGGMRDY